MYVSYVQPLAFYGESNVYKRDTNNALISSWIRRQIYLLRGSFFKKKSLWERYLAIPNTSSELVSPRLRIPGSALR